MLPLLTAAMGILENRKKQKQQATQNRIASDLGQGPGQAPQQSQSLNQNAIMGLIGNLTDKKGQETHLAGDMPEPDHSQGDQTSKDPLDWAFINGSASGY